MAITKSFSNNDILIKKFYNGILIKKYKRQSTWPLQNFSPKKLLKKIKLSGKKEEKRDRIERLRERDLKPNNPLKCIKHSLLTIK